MAKRNKSKEILERLADRAKAEKRVHFTFSINSTVLESFREKCEKEELKMAPVIEELIRAFLED